MGRRYTRIAAKGHELKVRRLALGYTQRDFAKAVGVSQAQLSLIEAGRSGASEEKAIAIAQRLRCNVSDVFDIIMPASSDDTSDDVEHERALFARV